MWRWILGASQIMGDRIKQLGGRKSVWQEAGPGQLLGSPCLPVPPFPRLPPAEATNVC